MADNKNIKSQRDRFLAFAFASADLFIEVAEDGEITYALGAARSLTGIDHTTLKGQPWLNLFDSHDRNVLAAMRKRSREGERCGPYKVKMDAGYGGRTNAIVTGIRMPDREAFYVTVSFPSELMMKMAQIVEEQQGVALLDKDSFLYAAMEAFDLARSVGEGIDMTLLDIPETKRIREKYGDDVWNSFTGAMTDLLGANSIDGKAIAEIRDGRYSIIHDHSIDADSLREQIYNLSRETDPDGEGFEILSKTVTSDLESLSERETTKALVYTINEFERKGTGLNIETLNSGFKAYVSANAQKIHHFKTMIEQLSFNLEFQPIVEMQSNILSHYEIVSRFKGEGSTREWVNFGEDIGMAADFDIAVCERVINYLRYKGATNRWRFAVNLSGHSMQNEQFFKTLNAKLDMNKELAKRMIFEITESTNIVELEMVNHFIRTLQQKGYQVCLDDFGAGATSFQHLHQLHVDYVKIDGQYTRRLLTSQRDQVLVKNICHLCNELGITVIGEHIETQDQMLKMRALGAALGQGYYYGYPAAAPAYDHEKVPATKPKAVKA